MTTLEPRTLRPVLNRVAPDNSVTAGPRSLAQMVDAAVRSVDESVLRPVHAADVRLAFQPKSLLSLLTYCYAGQIYGSVEIEDVVRRDAYVRQLCGSEFPSAVVIRRFRRDNRQAIRFCLLAVLSLLAEQKMAAGIVTRVNKAHLAEEAGRRIIMAIFTDASDAATADGN